jgi:hypothetical protein
MNSVQAFKLIFEEFDYTLDELLKDLRKRNWKERDIENVEVYLKGGNYIHALTLNMIEDVLPPKIRAYYSYLRMLNNNN